MVLEDLRGRWMILGKRLIAVDLWILGFMAWSLLSAICKMVGTGFISDWIGL